MNNKSMALDVIKNFSLEDLYITFLEYNKSGQAPYHNNQHTREMICNCHEGAAYYKLSDYCQNILIVAAMFHDFNHTAGQETTDDINIKNAIEGFIEHSKYEKFSARFIWDVCHLIAATEYPYKESDEWNTSSNIRNIEEQLEYGCEWSETLTLLKAIICDANVMTIYQEDKDILGKQLAGLYQEMSIKSNISKEDFVKGCTDFYYKYKFRTDWALDKAGYRKKTWQYHARKAIIVLEKHLNS